MVTYHPDHDELSELLARGTDQELGDFLSLLHPADVADLIEISSEQDRKRIFHLLDAEQASDALAVVEDPHRDDVIDAIPKDTLVEIVDEMESDDATDLLMELPQPMAQEILERIDDEDQARIQHLLRFAEDSAGGIMQSELISVTSDASVSQVIETIRSLRDEVDDVHCVYVTDADKHLQGIVDLKSLILADTDTLVSRIMEPDLIKCHVHDDEEQVARLFMKYDVVSLPVVDDDDCLVGRILIDDVMDVLEDQVDEDFLLMAGAGEEELADPAVIGSVKARLPWVMIAWVGEIITGLVIGYFSGTLEKMIVLTVFIPVIMAMGGSIGTQSSTIMVRTMATSRVDFKRVFSLLFKEIRVGLLLGIFTGLILLGFAMLRYDSAVGLGMVAGISITITMAMSALIGAAIPALFDTFGIDPAVATAPLVTMTCDIFGILVYLSLATLLIIQMGL